ncbi:MAG: hypothetical protein H6Q89_4745 [Myxococcaceae bacterium]|nr:hypothetical protein [Myxococcaceae bacterium]
MLAQVVTLPGIVVKRGTTSLAAGAAVRSLNDPPPPVAGVLLAQWMLAITGPGVCDRTLRPELIGNAVSFSRGNGSTNAFCTASSLSTVFLEKVDFRSTALVQQVQLTMGTGTAMTSATLTPVDRTRTLVFTGAQGSTGQSLGEGTHLGTTNTTDLFGEISVSLGLGGTAFQSTQLEARRSSSLGASRWTAFVVELIP